MAKNMSSLQIAKDYGMTLIHMRHPDPETTDNAWQRSTQALGRRFLRIPFSRRQIEVLDNKPAETAIEIFITAKR